jgi:type VI secretion system secreted protein Hcp
VRRKVAISQNIYLTIKGQTLGYFVGEERDGSIECLFYEQLITSPRDPSTGIANGHIKHNGILIRKQVDGTSPQFLKAMETGETLETVEIQFVPSNGSSGSSVACYCVRLTNASIASFKQYYSDTPSARYFGWQLLEEIMFYYQKVEWGFYESDMVASTWHTGIL